MAQASAITINDGAATPVATTFSPESVTPELSSFADRTIGIANGFKRIRLSNVFPKDANQANKARMTIEMPVTAVVDGASKVLYTLRADVTVLLPQQSTDAERKNLYAFLKNGLAHTLVQGAMRDLDPLY